METCSSARLDIQENQINQLQRDVAEIRNTLQSLDEDRIESSVFRKVVLGWMQQQEKKYVAGSSGSGSGFSGPISPSPSLLAQLEALVSRSEERLRGYGHLMSTSHTDSRSSVSVSPLSTPGTHVVSIRSKSDLISVGQGSSTAPLLRSPSSLPNSPSFLAPLKTIISRSDNSLDQGCLMSHSVNEVISDCSQGMLGSGTVVGKVVEPQRVLSRYYPDLGPFCGNVQLVAQDPASLPESSSFASIVQADFMSVPLILTPVAGLLRSFAEFIRLAFVSQQLHTFAMLPNQFPLLMVVSMFKMGDRRLGWKGGTVINECYSIQISDELVATDRFLTESQNREILVDYCLRMLLYQLPSASRCPPPGLSVSQSNRVIGKTPLHHDMLLLRELGLLPIVYVRDFLAEFVFTLYVAAYTARRHDTTYHLLAEFVYPLYVAACADKRHGTACHLWVVHGQGRPPDDTAASSLEDKTVLKGGVMMGMSWIIRRIIGKF